MRKRLVREGRILKSICFKNQDIEEVSYRLNHIKLFIVIKYELKLELLVQSFAFPKLEKIK